MQDALKEWLVFALTLQYQSFYPQINDDDIKKISKTISETLTKFSDTLTQILDRLAQTDKDILLQFGTAIHIFDIFNKVYTPIDQQIADEAKIKFSKETLIGICIIAYKLSVDEVNISTKHFVSKNTINESNRIQRELLKKIDYRVSIIDDTLESSQVLNRALAYNECITGEKSDKAFIKNNNRNSLSQYLKTVIESQPQLFFDILANESFKQRISFCEFFPESKQLLQEQIAQKKIVIQWDEHARQDAIDNLADLSIPHWSSIFEILPPLKEEISTLFNNKPGYFMGTLLELPVEQWVIFFDIIPNSKDILLALYNKNPKRFFKKITKQSNLALLILFEYFSTIKQKLNQETWDNCIEEFTGLSLSQWLILFESYPALKEKLITLETLKRFIIKNNSTRWASLLKKLIKNKIIEDLTIYVQLIKFIIEQLSPSASNTLIRFFKASNTHKKLLNLEKSPLDLMPIFSDHPGLFIFFSGSIDDWSMLFEKSPEAKEAILALFNKNLAYPLSALISQPIALWPKFFEIFPEMRDKLLMEENLKHIICLYDKKEWASLLRQLIQYKIIEKTSPIYLSLIKFIIKTQSLPDALTFLFSHLNRNRNASALTQEAVNVFIKNCIQDAENYWLSFFTTSSPIITSWLTLFEYHPEVKELSLSQFYIAPNKFFEVMTKSPCNTWPSAFMIFPELKEKSLAVFQESPKKFFKLLKNSSVKGWSKLNEIFSEFQSKLNNIFKENLENFLDILLARPFYEWPYLFDIFPILKNTVTNTYNLKKIINAYEPDSWNLLLNKLVKYHIVDNPVTYIHLLEYVVESYNEEHLNDFFNELNLYETPIYRGLFNEFINQVPKEYRAFICNKFETREATTIAEKIAESLKNILNDAGQTSQNCTVGTSSHTIFPKKFINLNNIAFKQKTIGLTIDESQKNVLRETRLVFLKTPDMAYDACITLIKKNINDNALSTSLINTIQSQLSFEGQPNPPSYLSRR